MSHQNVLILDFGGQYNQLIARRVRDLGVYCEIIPFRTATVEKIRSYSPIGLIFTGGPISVFAEPISIPLPRCSSRCRLRQSPG